jgi:GH25 family lysozyme M1 (1,4-beta-N-acetylmuramidase)
MAWSCGSSTHTKGVDVNGSDQGSQIGTESYWRSLRTDGYTFAAIKATQGTTYVAEYLQAAWSACNAVNGLDSTYLYHFINWDTGGEAQANHFWATIRGLTNPTFDGPKTVLTADIEEGTGTPSVHRSE